MKKNGYNLPESLHLLTFGSISRSLGTIRDYFRLLGMLCGVILRRADLELIMHAWFGRYCITHAKYTGNSHCLSGMHVGYAIVGQIVSHKGS